MLAGSIDSDLVLILMIDYFNTALSQRLPDYVNVWSEYVVVSN